MAILSREAVEEAAGALEFGEKFFFGAKFAGVRDKRATGTPRRMFNMQHFVIEDILDDELRDAGVIHAAVKKDLVGPRIVTAELAPPGARAPAEMRTHETPFEEFSV